MTQLLVVEGEQSIALDLSRRLTALGLTVVATVVSGEEAIQSAAQWRPDLALVDVALSGAMDGIALALQLRTMYDIPVIFLTADFDPTTLERAKVAAPYGYVQKPFGGHELGMAVDMAVQRYQLGREQIQQQRADAALEERKRLAAELHDNLVQLLGFVKLQAFSARELLTRGESEAADVLLQRIVDSAQEAQAEIRQQIRDLYVRVTSEGFATALRACARGFENDGLSTVLDLSLPQTVEDVTLDPESCLQLVRIVQEALANVRKHARASRVRIRFDIVDGCLAGSVTDNGCGFDEHSTEWAAQRHFGLQIMRERARAIDGRLEVTSAPGQGTRVSIVVPLDRA